MRVLACVVEMCACFSMCGRNVCVFKHVAEMCACFGVFIRNVCVF